MEGARMLERRVSNNRADLNADQRLNYLIAWFTSWSELQRDDFAAILAAAAHNAALINGQDHVGDTDAGNKKMSLFDCQTKLFREWYAGLSDDQKHYLVVRLRDVDADFGDKYDRKVAQVANSDFVEEKDYFEPGIPEHLVRKPSIIDNNDNKIIENDKERNVVASPAKVIEEEESDEACLKEVEN